MVTIDQIKLTLNLWYIAESISIENLPLAAHNRKTWMAKEWFPISNVCLCAITLYIWKTIATVTTKKATEEHMYHTRVNIRKSICFYLWIHTKPVRLCYPNTSPKYRVQQIKLESSRLRLIHNTNSVLMTYIIRTDVATEDWQRSRMRASITQKSCAYNNLLFFHSGHIIVH